MQLFQLDLDIGKSVQAYYDIHINKTIVELTQCIAAACIRQGITPPNKKNGQPYKGSHLNHPLVNWILDSGYNPMTVLSYIGYLNSEYKYRFYKEKDHACITSLLEWVGNYNFTMLSDSIDDTEPATELYPGCPPWNGHAAADVTDEQIIEGYRQYYMTEKKHLCKYTRRQMPEWMKEEK